MKSNFGKGNHSSCTSYLKWPGQICPSPQCWTIWRRSLQILFTKLLKSHQLNQAYSLYHWLPYSLSHQKWPTFIDSSTLLLFSRNPGSPNTYSIYIPRHRFSHTSSGTSTPLLSINSDSITVSSWTPFAVSTLFHYKQAPPGYFLLPPYTIMNPNQTHTASTFNAQTAQCHHPLSILL